MKYRIYGFDAKQADFFERYKKANISAIVSGKDEERIKKSNENDIDYYICTGAFGCSDDMYLARDVDGIARKWFGSGCPNSEYLREKNLESIKELAKTPGIKGIIIDGARFSSVASTEGFEPFFTCFCDVCITKMNNLGFDSEKIKEAVTALRNLCRDGRMFDKEKYLPLLFDWLEFRRICVSEHFKNVRDVIKAQNPSLIFGAYIFTPAINNLVGQNYEDLSKICDQLSPMIYRHYKNDSGPACIDHEVRAIVSQFEDKPQDIKEFIIDIFNELGKTDYAKYGTTKELKECGVNPKIIGEETASACAQSGKTPVVPIILLDDTQMKETLNGCFETPVEEIDFFLYEKKAFDAYVNLL